MKKMKTRARSKATPSSLKTVKHKQASIAKVIDGDTTIHVKPGLLEMRNARAIAKSLKDTADKSDKLSSSPFHSAMSVLNHLIAHLELQKARLEAAKKELRALYGEEDVREGGEPHPPKEFGTHRGGPAESFKYQRAEIQKRARRGRQPKSG